MININTLCAIAEIGGTDGKVLVICDDTEHAKATTREARNRPDAILSLKGATFGKMRVIITTVEDAVVTSCGHMFHDIVAMASDEMIKSVDIEEWMHIMPSIVQQPTSGLGQPTSHLENTLVRLGMVE